MVIALNLRDQLDGFRSSLGFGHIKLELAFSLLINRFKESSMNTLRYLIGFVIVIIT